MNDVPQSPEPTRIDSGAALEALAAAHNSLRNAFHISLVMLLILSGSLFVFFMREISIARRQITELTQIVTEYEKNAVPVVEDLKAKLQAFASTNPDFAPIFARYFGSTNAPPSTERGQAQPVTNPAGARLPPGR